MSSYLHHIPEELYGIIIEKLIDEDADNIFNTILSYPELKEPMIRSFIISIGLYPEFKAVEDYFNGKMKTVEIFIKMIKYAVDEYDFSDMNFVEKYKRMLIEGTILSDDIKEIVAIVKIWKEYPLIYDYLKYKGYKYNNMDTLDLLSEGIYHILHLHEDDIIKILSLWEMSNRYNLLLKDVEISKKLYKQLKNNWKLKLAKFLIDKGVIII